jgi:hypothetical protein
MREVDFDKGLGAQNSAIGKVTHAAAQHGGEREPAFLFQHFLESCWSDGLGVLFSCGSSAKEGFAVGGVGIGPIDIGTVDTLNAGAGGFVPGNSFAVAAEAVVFGIGSETRAHAVEVNIECDGLNGSGLRFNQDGFESLGKESAVAVVGFIKPSSEALFHQLHEGGDITHKSELTGSPGVSIGAASRELVLDNVEAFGLVLRGFRMEQLVAAEKFGVGWRSLDRDFE